MTFDRTVTLSKHEAVVDRDWLSGLALLLRSCANRLANDTGDLADISKELAHVADELSSVGDA